MINKQIVKLNTGSHIHDYLYRQHDDTFKKVRMIDLQGCILTERDGQAIEKMCRKDKSIQALDLSKTDLSDSHLTTIIDMIKSGQGNIEVLKLNENNRILTDRDQVRRLAECFENNKTSLRVLELNETNLKEDGFYELIKSLRNNTIAETLRCRMCRIHLSDLKKMEEIK